VIHDFGSSEEPNRSSESSGVTLLDDYLKSQFQPVARFGPYVVLRRRLS